MTVHTRESGADAVATIPWSETGRVDGGYALRVILADDTEMLLVPTGPILLWGRRRVRALASQLRELRNVSVA